MCPDRIFQWIYCEMEEHKDWLWDATINTSTAELKTLIVINLTDKNSRVSRVFAECWWGK